MKKMIHAQKSNMSTTGKIHIEFFHPTASHVNIAGTFNDWKPAATPMVELGGGRWGKVLILPPGTYEYLLVADGYWTPDPNAKETVPNSFGTFNCVLRVESSNGQTTAHLANSAQKECWAA
jgi:1,4-alpha-glucan branching enzyme